MNDRIFFMIIFITKIKPIFKNIKNNPSSRKWQLFFLLLENNEEFRLLDILT